MIKSKAFLTGVIKFAITQFNFAHHHIACVIEEQDKKTKFYKNMLKVFKKNFRIYIF